MHTEYCNVTCKALKLKYQMTILIATSLKVNLPKFKGVYLHLTLIKNEFCYLNSQNMTSRINFTYMCLFKVDI